MILRHGAALHKEQIRQPQHKHFQFNEYIERCARILLLKFNMFPFYQCLQYTTVPKRLKKEAMCINTYINICKLFLNSKYLANNILNIYVV